MKKYLIIIALLIGYINTSFSNDTIAGRVIFYQTNNLHGSSNSYKLFANDSLLIRLKNNTYFVYDCSPGLYSFTVDKLKNSQLPLVVEKGKTYYIRLIENTGMFRIMPELLLVDSLTANSKIRNGSLTKVEKTNLPFKRPKNRLGIFLGYGIGTNSIKVASTADSNSSSISFGGGALFGLKYGREFGQHFDLACDFNYQFSFLIPSLTNAATNFDRSFISLTPSYIIPLGDGEKMRFKVGAGIDYYWYSKLIINTSKLTNGFDDSWKYDQTFGYHVRVNFEMNLNERWSLEYALKYYNVKYNATYENPASGDKFYNTIGSGVDLIIGLNYHF